MNASSLARALSLFLLFVLSGRPLWAQATATISGTVVNQGQAVLPGVTVTARHTATLVTRETVTNEVGFYSFPALERGEYEVRGELQGFSPTARRVEVLTGATATVLLELGVANLQETLTVVAEAPLVETTQSTSSSAIRQTEVMQMPMLNRNLSQILTLLPGARESTAAGGWTASGFNYVSFGGGSRGNQLMLVDGANNREHHDGGNIPNYSLEGVEEIKTFTSGFGPEYGKGTAIILLATKSGTNVFRGSGFYYGRNESLIATDYFSRPENGGLGKQPFSRQQYGGSFGGPAVRNRMWFFGAAERLQQDITLTRPDRIYDELQLLTTLPQLRYEEPLLYGVKVSRSIDRTAKNLMTQGKVNFQLGQNQSIFVRYATEHGRQANSAAVTQSELACCLYVNDQLVDIWVVSGGWTTILSPTTVNQLSVQVFDALDNNTYARGGCVDLTACLSQKLQFPSVTTGVTNGFPYFQHYTRKIEVRDDFSKQVGQHALKFGGSYYRLPTFGGQLTNLAPGFISFFDDPSVILTNAGGRYPQGFQTPGIVRAITVTTGTIGNYDSYGTHGNWSLGAYVQDDFRVSQKWTLNLGLRYDVYDIMNSARLANNRTYQVLKAIGSPYGSDVPKVQKADLAPRVGVAWDVDGTGKHVIRASGGVFYGEGLMNTYYYPSIQSGPTVSFQQTFANTAIGVGQLAQFVYGVSPLPTAPVAPTEYPSGVNSAGSWYDPDLKTPRVYNVHAGYSRAFERAALAVDYTRMMGYHTWRRVDVNPLLPNPANLNGPRIRPLSDDTQRVYGDANLLGPVDILDDVNRAAYDELTVHFERRFSRATGFQVNYTLAYARGMGGFAVGDPGASPPTPQIPSETGGDLDNSYEWGPTANDERHRVTVTGVFTLPYGIDVAPSLTLASRRPYTQYGAVNPSGAPVGFTNPFLFLAGDDGQPLGVNNARGDYLVNANARITKNVALPRNHKIGVFAELYNLFNRANFGGSYGGNAFAPATFNRPIGYLQGAAVSSSLPVSFQAQFGARYSF